MKTLEQLAGFCPICLSPVVKVLVNGEVKFDCPKHGPMNFVLDEHPLAKRNEFVKHCNSLGILDLEAPPVA